MTSMADWVAGAAAGLGARAGAGSSLSSSSSISVAGSGGQAHGSHTSHKGAGLEDILILYSNALI